MVSFSFVKINVLGAVLWTAGILAFVPQVLSALHWPVSYSYRHNLISDLGVTRCGIFDEGTRVERFICSPWHEVANLGTIANGVILAVGALLLWNAWPKRTIGRVAMFLFTVGGVLIIAVGVFPWDTHPELHNLTAITQGLFQWVGMALLLISIRKAKDLRVLWWLTLVSLAVSLAGFALFLNAVGGGFAASLGLGLTERIAFDTLTIWGAAAGFLLLKAIMTNSGLAGNINQPLLNSGTAHPQGLPTH